MKPYRSPYSRSDLIERDCLHGDWSLVCDDLDRPSIVICGKCGADRAIQVRWSYGDVIRQEGSIAPTGE